MSAFQKILILLAVVFSTSSAYFFNWGTQETTPYPPYYYYQRVMQGPSSYTDPPSIPVHTPLQAQLAPATVHNVQLVPCLCPVSQDSPYENSRPEYIAAAPSQHKTN